MGKDGEASVSRVVVRSAPVAIWLRVVFFVVGGAMLLLGLILMLLAVDGIGFGFRHFLVGAFCWLVAAVLFGYSMFPKVMPGRA